jgi:hypothetical protein
MVLCGAIEALAEAAPARQCCPVWQITLMIMTMMAAAIDAAP